MLADAAFGSNTAFREGLNELGLRYAVGVISSLTVWAPGTGPLSAARYKGHGRRPHRLRRAPGHQPVTVKALALRLKPSAWRMISWREGTNGTLSSRFGRVRVRAAHRDYLRTGMPEEQWLLIEWPAAETEPTKYWLSNLPADISIKQLVDTAKMRWRIEHDYHELKQEFGLSHYEGRGWLGFHHHATLCIAAYGFLSAQRLKQATKKNTARLQAAALPADYQPRGSRPSAASRPRFHPDPALPRQPGTRASPDAMPVLRVGGEACVTQYD